MGESCIERMERIDAKKKISDFMVKEKMPYDFKVKYAKIRAREFVEECDRRGLNYHVSVGGLDSITLFLFLKSIGIHAPGISVSSLEDESIQRVHKMLGIERLKSAIHHVDPDGRVHYWHKPQIIQEFGFPVLSKEIAGKIETLQNPTEKNATVRHAIITGETGEYGGFQKESRMQMSHIWLKKFAGYENENEGVQYKIAPFNVSSQCCYYLKEKPCDDWAKGHNSVPFLGLMASEGGRRAKSLRVNGCNYFGKSTIRSAPFAIFSRQDLLQLALYLNVPVPEIYGEIVRDPVKMSLKEISEYSVTHNGALPQGKLRTTKAQRTGCDCCGFGIHLEERPHRFDMLRERNPKGWEFWMYNCCTDPVTGEKFGWGRVLDYIGVEWETPYQEQLILEDI